jgi:hypothetical protein
MGMIADRDYSKMEFNPTVKRDLTVAYPKLKSIVGTADNRMLKYVLLMYDMNSPLREYYPELEKRKQFAASMAGYDLDKDDVTGLFDFKVKVEDEEVAHEELLNLITKYLKYQNNYMWSMIVSNEQAFYEFNKRVMIPVDGQRDKDILQAVDIKNKLMDAQDTIVQRLQKYFRELTGEDDQLEQAITKRKRLRPENIDVQPNR